MSEDAETDATAGARAEVLVDSDAIPWLPVGEGVALKVHSGSCAECGEALRA
jgi:hypothetical protein